MDDVKDKFKGMMKKMNNPFSSSSGKFTGQGRVLGSSSNATYQDRLDSLQKNVDKQKTGPMKRAEPRPQLPPVKSSDSVPGPPEKSGNFSAKSDYPGRSGFDPFSPVISSRKSSQMDNSVDVFECPLCGTLYNSEEEVSRHASTCLDSGRNDDVGAVGSTDEKMELRNKCLSSAGTFMSGDPSKETVDVVLKLLKNIITDPNNTKFRRIRMTNPKICDTVGSAVGGVELLECVGFRLQEEEGEMWATMETPSELQVFLIREVISSLEPSKTSEPSPSSSVPPNDTMEQKKVDRQVRVFFAVPESVAAKIDLPDSFYNVTAEELKKEVDLRKKKIAESQLLIPKSYKEKQAKLAKKKCKVCVIRIQFPDGVLLQGVFLPSEATTALYEFVSSCLKEPSLEFELLQPAVPRSRLVPKVANANGRTPTLEEEDLIPATLVKFKPIETDSILFTGLRNELLEIIEPLNAG
ncbi:plant UBX domain-containing protein 2 [Nymphaea colorata]|nr:plant UBX domain-containing protein 2 [Nymphaea colorata]